MARFEALLAPASNASDWSAAIEQLAQEWQGLPEWLDGRNASLTVHVAPTGLQVKLLLELQHSGQLGVLISSRKGMSRGAIADVEAAYPNLGFHDSLIRLAKDYGGSTLAGSIKVTLGIVKW
jgi:hypothetical protein